MKISVSGNRKGLSEASRKYIRQYISQHQIQQFHHGDCIGLDADIHQLCHEQKIKVVIHPPNSNKLRANCKPNEQDQVRLQKQFLKRNKEMVNESDILIAFPPTKQQIVRSGTWATIRYARKAKKPLIIVFQDGSFKEEKA